MKQVFRLLFIVLSLSASFASCQKEVPTELILTTTELSFAIEGGDQLISFATNKNWTASSSASWVKLSATSGDSNVKTISVTADVNSDYDDRTCVITITADEISKAINVTQSSNIGLIVSPNSFDLDYNENVISINVRHNVDLSVIIPDSSREWIQMSSTNATKSLVDDAISLRIFQNTTREIRESSITIKQVDGPLSETVLIRQAHYDGLETNPQSFSIDKEEQIIEVCVISSMDYDVYYNSGVVCDWITLFDERKVDDLESTLSFKINENTDASSRSENIYFLSKDGELKSQVSISQGPTYHIDIFSGQSDYVLSCYDQELSFSLQTNANPLEY